MTDETRDETAAEEWDRIWRDAPENEMVPFLEKDDKEKLAADGTVIYVTGMAYVENSQFGPRFGATVIMPSGEERYMTMKSAGGSTPRDKVNKWMFNLLKTDAVRSIPAILLKRGQAFMFDKPPSDE